MKCRKLKEDVCKRVRPITIKRGRVIIAQTILGFFGLIRLAETDGFETIGDFTNFFEQQYGLPFEGVLIE